MLNEAQKLLERVTGIVLPPLPSSSEKNGISVANILRHVVHALKDTADQVFAPPGFEYSYNGSNRVVKSARSSNRSERYLLMDQLVARTTMCKNADGKTEIIPGIRETIFKLLEADYFKEGTTYTEENSLNGKKSAYGICKTNAFTDLTQVSQEITPLHTDQKIIPTLIRELKFTRFFADKDREPEIYLLSYDALVSGLHDLSLDESLKDAAHLSLNNGIPNRLTGVDSSTIISRFVARNGSFEMETFGDSFSALENHLRGKPENLDTINMIQSQIYFLEKVRELLTKKKEAGQDGENIFCPRLE